MLLILIFLIKYKSMKKEVEIGLFFILFNPFLNLSHACIARLDMSWVFWFGKIVWLKKQLFEPYI